MADIVFNQAITDRTEDALTFTVKMPAGALGVLGHDRIRVEGQPHPTIGHAMRSLRDSRTRQRGEPMPEVITVEVEGRFTARWASYTDGVTFTLTLSAAWKAHKPERVWRHILTKRLVVDAADYKPHPTWATLAGLGWELDEAGEVAA